MSGQAGERAAAPDLRLMFDALPNPVIILDERDHVVAVNTAAEKSFFRASCTVLMRLSLPELVPFKPGAAIGAASARERGCGERICHRRRHTAGWVVSASLTCGRTVGDDGRYVMMMLLRRSMAHKFDLQICASGGGAVRVRHGGDVGARDQESAGRHQGCRTASWSRHWRRRQIA